MVQLIQGTDVVLYGGAEPETVSNVLIGEPSSDGKSYTLGIPKGDQHTWTDKKLGFFGCYFRTIGRPQQGIEANIPLSWHHKVKAELIESTGKCTIYDKATLTKHVFSDVFYFDGRGEKTTRTTGAEATDDVTVRIYSFAHDGSYIPKVGDIVVEGESSLTFDTSTEQKASESMATFRATYSHYATIKSVDVTTNGIQADINITGR
jgi:hypothetical protein